MGWRGNRQACEDDELRTHIGVSGNLKSFQTFNNDKLNTDEMQKVCAHVFVQLELQAHKNQPAGYDNNKLIWYSLLLWLQVVHHWQCQLFSNKLKTVLTNFSMWKNLSYLLQKYLFSSQKFSNTNKSGRNLSEQSACDQRSNWGRTLFLVIIPLLSFFLVQYLKSQKGFS